MDENYQFQNKKQKAQDDTNIFEFDVTRALYIFVVLLMLSMRKSVKRILSRHQ